MEYEPLGIPFDPPGVRVLAIAAREAEIVGIQTVVTTSGDVVMEPGNLLAGTMRRKVDHIREAAGSRFDAIELNTTISIELTGDRKAGARRLIAERGWQTRSGSGATGSGSPTWWSASGMSRASRRS